MNINRQKMLIELIVEDRFPNAELIDFETNTVVYGDGGVDIMTVLSDALHDTIVYEQTKEEEK